jgi:hypothetical protein
MSLSIMSLSIECHYSKCVYAFWREYLPVILSVVAMSVVMIVVVAPLHSNASGLTKRVHFMNAFQNRPLKPYV